MAHVLTLTPAAYSDIQKGFRYYNSQQKGLGRRFESAVKDAFEKIKKMPLAASGFR